MKRPSAIQLEVFFQSRTLVILQGVADPLSNGFCSGLPFHTVGFIRQNCESDQPPRWIRG